MLKIRLTRTGKRNQARFRVVLTEHTSSPQGKFIEILGSIDPYLNNIALKDDRIKYWLEKGAQPSSTVHNLLIDKGIMSGEKVTSWKRKKKEEKAEGK